MWLIEYWKLVVLIAASITLLVVVHRQWRRIRGVPHLQPDRSPREACILMLVVLGSLLIVETPNFLGFMELFCAFIIGIMAAKIPPTESSTPHQG